MALAHMLKNNFNIFFFCKEIPERIINELNKNQFSIEIIKDEQDFFNQVKKLDIIVCDGYVFDINYQKKIKTLGAKLVCIDDLHDHIYIADLIINHTPSIRPDDYKAETYTQYALGPEYAMLRPAFLEQAKKNRNISKIETVIICFGGSDCKNLSEHVLRIVSKYINIKKILVVTGAGYKESNSLNDLANRDNRIELYHSIDENKLLTLMIASDLAITSASGILLEVIAAGCIIISGTYTENQKYMYSNFKRLNSFIDAKEFEESDLKNAILKSLHYKAKCETIIDGNSGKRLLYEFLKLDAHERITLRKVHQNDLEITFQWASNPSVRAYSFQKQMINKHEHISWFYSKLSDKNCLYFIAEFNDCKIGSIRFDLQGFEAIISYLIDPKYQGQGFGQSILALGIHYIKTAKNKVNHNIKKIIGIVMKDNIKSIKAFEYLGFTKYEEHDQFKFEMII